MIAGALARTAERLREGGEPYVHATVVRAQHPTSVHAGDAAIVHPDGTVDGFVGGHCALESVRLHAEQVLATGEPLLLRIVPVPEERDRPLWTSAATPDAAAIRIADHYRELRARPLAHLINGGYLLTDVLLEHHEAAAPV